MVGWGWEGACGYVLQRLGFIIEGQGGTNRNLHEVS